MLKLLKYLRKGLLKNGRYYCPCCGSSYKLFLSEGTASRKNARCPGCGSLERHRLLWLVLTDNWFKRNKSYCSGKLLHVAPESCLEPRFKERFEYLSADIDESVAMVRMDLTDIDIEDNYFDAVVCNHVLEHIPDDIRALSELYRVLKVGGWASLQVPIKGDVTQEDPTITDPERRRVLYGQADHVRQYGLDYLEKLKEVGFKVQVFDKASLSAEVLDRGIDASDVEKFVVLCVKPE